MTSYGLSLPQAAAKKIFPHTSVPIVFLLQLFCLTELLYKALFN